MMKGIIAGNEGCQAQWRKQCWCRALEVHLLGRLLMPHAASLYYEFPFKVLLAAPIYLVLHRHCTNPIHLVSDNTFKFCE